MTGNTITQITQGLDICSVNVTSVMSANGTDDPCYHSDCEQMQVSIAVTLSLLVGLIMVRGGGGGSKRGRRVCMEHK